QLIAARLICTCARRISISCMASSKTGFKLSKARMTRSTACASSSFVTATDSGLRLDSPWSGSVLRAGFLGALQFTQLPTYPFTKFLTHALALHHACLGGGRCQLRRIRHHGAGVAALWPHAHAWRRPQADRADL